MKKIIFTDLDGTLLNHHNYSFNESKDALMKIKEQNIPLIFTTSKTRAEVEVLQKKIGLQEPFIVENGAALLIPKNYQNLNLDLLDDFIEYKIIRFGQTYKQILNFYNRYKDEFNIIGFSDMTTTVVSESTGLSIENTKLSKQRDFTEPFILKDISKLQNLRNLAMTEKIKITKGGRFYHLMGDKQDKGIAVKRTIELFTKLFNTNIKSIALGDGENDIEMLQNVDIPIAIKNHTGKYLSLDLDTLQKSTNQGSAGFNEMVLKNV